MKFGPIIQQIFAHYSLLPILGISILFIIAYLGISVGLSNLIGWILYKFKITKTFNPKLKESKRVRNKRNVPMQSIRSSVHRKKDYSKRRTHIE